MNTTTTRPFSCSEEIFDAVMRARVAIAGFVLSGCWPVRVAHVVLHFPATNETCVYSLRLNSRINLRILDLAKSAVPDLGILTEAVRALVLSDHISQPSALRLIGKYSLLEGLLKTPSAIQTLR